MTTYWLVNGDWVKCRGEYGIVTRPLSEGYVEIYLADLGKRIVRGQELELLEEAPSIPPSQRRAMLKAASDEFLRWLRRRSEGHAVMPSCKVCR